MTDEALLESVQGGDESAFRALYERYRDPLYRFGCRLTGSPESAEDLVHDSFLALLSGGRFLRNRGPLRAYPTAPWWGPMPIPSRRGCSAHVRDCGGGSPPWGWHMNEPDKLAPEDPLRKALDTWRVTPPGAALDYRLLASYRGRMLAVPLWKRLLRVRLSVPLPVAALAGLLLLTALLWRPPDCHRLRAGSPIPWWCRCPMRLAISPPPISPASCR
jgi:hypothetical protein